VPLITEEIDLGKDEIPDWVPTEFVQPGNFALTVSTPAVAWKGFPIVQE
jgi:hypothetical protein